MITKFLNVGPRALVRRKEPHGAGWYDALIGVSRVQFHRGSCVSESIVAFRQSLCQDTRRQCILRTFYYSGPLTEPVVPVRSYTVRHVRASEELILDLLLKARRVVSSMPSFAKVALALEPAIHQKRKAPGHRVAKSLQSWSLRYRGHFEFRFGLTGLSGYFDDHWSLIWKSLTAATVRRRSIASQFLERYEVNPWGDVKDIPVNSNGTLDLRKLTG